MSITLVIPTYTLNGELEAMAFKCAKSYRDQVDELIITEDGGEYSSELRKISDVYIYNKENRGFTKNVNQGWKLSRGTYTMIVNSDTELIEGKLEDLCLDVVTHPIVENVQQKGAFFCVPKHRTQLLDERMKTYYSDTRYFDIESDSRIVDTVKVLHRVAATVTPAGVEGKGSEDDQEYRRIKYENR